MSDESSSSPAGEMLAEQLAAAPSEGEQQLARHEQKKRRGFDYVPADSAEADTLKDKFWRDLDQGKIYFDNAEDMYTRVKRPSKQLQLNLRSHRCVRRAQSLQIHSLTSSDDITPSIGLPSSAGPTYTGPALVPASGPVDAFTPSSSGYDSSSIPSVGATTTADSPVEMLPMLPMLSCGRRHDWRKKKRLKNQKLKKHTTKTVLSSHNNGQTHVSSMKKQSKGEGKFFCYVSANSAEADTLKDKFWRELDQGLVSITAATDLYSSVKVARRSRQLAVATLSSLDPTSSGPVTPSYIPTASTNETVSPGDEASSNPELSSSGQSEGCKVVESDDREQTSGNGKCANAKDEREAPSKLSNLIGLHKREHSESELTFPNPDCKLNSPCAVSVKRLQFCDFKCSTDEDNGDSEKHCSKLDEEDAQAAVFHRENNSTCTNDSELESLSSSRCVSLSSGPNVTAALNTTTARDEIGESRKQRVAWSAKRTTAVNSNVFCSSAESSSSACEIDRLSSVENVKLGSSRAAATYDTSQVDSDSSSGSDTDTSSRPPRTVSAAGSVVGRTNAKGTLWEAVESGDLCYVRHIVLNELSSSPHSQIHVRDKDGTTLLMLATRLGNIAIVRLLMMNGIEINAQNRAGLTALMIACSLGCKEIASTLLGKGALMELRDMYGETALFKAVRACDTDIICMLLGSGVNIGAMVASGRSALNVAVDNHRRDIVDLINRHILRLKVTFKEEIERSLAGIANLGTAVFPLQCFALHECVPSVSITFKGIPAQIHRGQLGVLFVGHAHVGIHTVRCWLSGSCAVTAVCLNKAPLQPLSAAGNFVTCFEPIVEETNELVLYVSPQSTATQNEVKLLVSAYFVDWSYLPSPFS